MMGREIDRRDFLKQGVSASAGVLAGLSFEERALLAQEQKASNVLKWGGDAKGMATGKIGKLKVSRVICGGNLISTFAHSRDLIYVSPLLRNYFTDEKVMETFEICEESGINTAILRLDERCVRLINKHWKERGGGLQWIVQIKPKKYDLGACPSNS